MTVVTFDDILKIADWSTTRSSGPGGQHVNKTNSAVILKIDILALPLPIDTLNRIMKKLNHRIIQETYISVRSESERDQRTNKSKAVEVLLKLLNDALYIQPKRIKTKPTRSSVQKRLNSKNQKSQIKKMRQEKF